jgi:hypothetical protein
MAIYVDDCPICGAPVTLGANGMVFKCGHGASAMNIWEIEKQAEEKAKKKSFWQW